MRKALAFGLILISLFVFFSQESSATTSSPSAGSFRCDRQSGARDCYFSVPSPGSDFQAYRVAVQSWVDQIFTDDNSSVVVEVCIAQSNSFPGANPLWCSTPISRWVPPPPIRLVPESGPAEIEVPMGNSSSPGNWVNFHIRIKNAYSDTKASVWGRRVSVDKFYADKTTVNSGESTKLHWEVDWAENVTIDNGVGTFPGGFGITTDNGNVETGPLYSNKIYNISASGPGGFEGAINVTAPPVTITVTSPSPSPTFVNLDFNVKDVCTSNPVSGATANIDQDFGNGTSRTTDGSGFANFGVYKNKTIGWTVSKTGYTDSGGSVVSSNDPTLVKVILNRSCGGPPPTCAASPATVKKNDTTTISAGGGDGTYSWSGGGTPATASGPTFTTSWSTTGTKNVTVTSGGNSGFCTVEVTSGQPPEPSTPICSASPTTVYTNQNVNFTGGSGDGVNYSWFEGATSLGVGQTMTNSWSTTGTKNVTVSSGGKNGTCPAITVNSQTGGTTNVIGFLDRPSSQSDCDVIGGWALDQDHKSEPITVILKDGATAFWTGSTNVVREDVNSDPNIQAPSGSTHGFNISTPQSLKDGQTRNIYSYGVDADTGKQVGLSGSPKSLTCGSQPPPPPAPVPPPSPGSASASCSVSVTNPRPNNPSGVSVTEPNYCLSGPAATTNWNYSDPAGSPQSAYQVQIDDQGSFNSPEWDSGKITCSGCRSNSTPQGILQFNTTYRARVRVWNQNDIASDWNVSFSWKTPSNAFPQVNFIFSPSQPASNIPVQFTDQTQFFDGNPNGRQWSWLFGDGGSSTQQNPVKSYANEGNYNVTLSATDNANQSCSISKPINIRIPNPIWKEVNPGG